MDPYTPKTFAVGEILTAQDVNEHLVNRLRRTVIENEAVIALESGLSFGSQGARVVLDEDVTTGAITYQLHMHIQNIRHPGQTGDISVALGTFGDWWISRTATFTGYASGPYSFYIGSITAGGVVSLRWASGSRDGGNFYFSA